MPTSLTRSGALAAILLSPSLAAAQGLTIQHQGVDCIVAGQYSRLSTCFTPASQLARGRVYFRPETLTTWYYVEAVSDAPCHAGVLPKAGQALIGKRILYYVEGFDRASSSSQTAEFAPIVVKSAEECREKGIVAPLSSTGPSAVFPFLPAGMGGGAGISTGVLAGGVAAAAVVTGGVIALTNDDDSPTTTIGPGADPPPPPSPPPPSPPRPTRLRRPGRRLRWW